MGEKGLIVIFLLIHLLRVNCSFGQELYNNCNNALEICPSENYTLNNLGSNITFCPDCEDDFNFCFPTNNTIWLTFTTNATGGDVTINFLNLVFESNPGQSNLLQTAVVSAGFPCDASTFSLVSSCHNNESGNFSMLAPALNPNSTYYVVIDGDLSGLNTIPAEFTFDLTIAGPGIDRPLPSISISGPTTPVCLNEVSGFYASTSSCPDNTSYNWYIDGNLVATTSDTFFFTSALSDGAIVSVSTACYALCPATVSAATGAIAVTSFLVNAGVDLTINSGEAVQLSAFTTAPDYTWSPSFLVSNPAVLNPITVPDETTIFSFTATQDGCSITDYVTIFVSAELEIPNTFSPNDDGVNDFWIISNIENYPDNSLNIYDRWGQEIYQATGYSEIKAWDGKTKHGNPATEGVYFYVLDLRDGTSELLKGSISLIR